MSRVTCQIFLCSGTVPVRRGVGQTRKRVCGERCTSTPHAARRRTAQARRARAHIAGASNASMGSASAHNASMHSASTKHGPVHSRDVDDFDERNAHDLDERCTSTQHAQHEGAQHGNAQQGHAQHRVRTARAHAADTCNTSMGGRKRAQRDWRACIAPAQSAAWSGTRAAADDPDVFSRKVSVRRPWSGRSSALPKCRAPCMASVPAQTRRRPRARAPPTAGAGRRAASSRRAAARAPTGAAASVEPFQNAI